MSEHPTREQLADYRGGHLTPDDMRAVDEHLAACVPCRERADDRGAAQPGRLTTAGEHEPVAPAAWRAWLSGWNLVRAGGVVLGVLVVLSAVRENVFFGPPAGRAAAGPGPAQGSRPVGVGQAQSIGAGAPVPADAMVVDAAEKVGLAASGSLRGLDHLPARLRERIADALRARSLSVATIPALAMPAGPLRATDAPPRFTLSLPVGRVVETDRPNFEWQPIDEATAYIVEVTDDRSSVVASSGEIVTPKWTPERPLARGRLHAWRVTAIAPGLRVTEPGASQPAARFVVLDAKRLADVELVRRLAPTAHLPLAVLYAEAAMPDEARRELRSLMLANPGSDLARDLMRSVR